MISAHTEGRVRRRWARVPRRGTPERFWWAAFVPRSLSVLVRVVARTKRESLRSVRRANR